MFQLLWTRLARGSPSRQAALSFLKQSSFGRFVLSVTCARRITEQQTRNSHAEILLLRRAEPDQGRALSRRGRASLRADRGRYAQGRAAQGGLSDDQSERQGAGDRRWR